LIKNVSPKNLVLVHGDVEVMKRFQKTVESTLDIRTYMPPNLQEIPFERVLFYHQISLNKELYDYLNYLMKISKKKLLNENIKDLKYKGGLIDNNDSNFNLKNNVQNNSEFNPVVRKEERKVGIIKFDKLDKIEKKNNLSLYLNLRYDLKSKNLIFSANNPLKRLNLKIGKFTNLVNLKIKNLNDFENVDFRNLFELYTQAKDNKMYFMYNHFLENNNLEIKRIENIVTVKWLKLNKIKEENNIFILIKFLDSFINLHKKI